MRFPAVDWNERLRLLRGSSDNVETPQAKSGVEINSGVLGNL